MTRKAGHCRAVGLKLPADVRISGRRDIAAILGSEILSGARRPGSRMPSAEEMLETFGVSRVVLREVTRTLAAKGMVTSKSRVGTLVTDPANWNLLDHDVIAWRLKLGVDANFLDQITEVRRAVEPAAAALAAENRTQKDLVRLRAAVRAMEDAVGNHRRFAEADVAFHVEVSTATGNPLFRAFTGIVETALSALFTMVSIDVATSETKQSQAAKTHGEIVDAIERRDRLGAQKAMTYVIERGLKRAAAQTAKR